MSEEGDSSEQGVGHDDDLIEPNKAKHKIIRVLTVIAYTLSVSMVAILLSIYYVFMWDGHPTLARKDLSYDHPMAQQQLKLPSFASPNSLKDLNYNESSIDNSKQAELSLFLGRNEQFGHLSEREISKENVLVDVPFEPTAIPVVEAKTEAPTPSTPETLLIENSINEDEFPSNNFTHLVEITKRSPLLKKLLLNKIMD